MDKITEIFDKGKKINVIKEISINAIGIEETENVWKESRSILEDILNRYPSIQFMNPWVVEHVKEKSIEASQAKFTWGAKSGKEIAALCPAARWVEDVSLVEGMKELYPIYRVIGRIPALRNLSNKLAVLEVCRNGE